MNKKYKLIESKINHIRHFQIKVKYKLYFIKKITAYLRLIHNIISSISHNIYYNLYLINIISKDKYNYYNEKLDEITVKFSKFDIPIDINIFKEYTEEFIKNEIKNILQLLLNLCELTGASKCSDIINLFSKGNDWKNNINTKYKQLLKFYDKYFICISTKLIENNNKINNIFL